jgi:hypothetical protein
MIHPHVGKWHTFKNTAIIIFMGSWRFQVSFMSESIIPFYDCTKELVTGYKGAIRNQEKIINPDETLLHV